MKVMILCGGKGTRIRNVTDDVPKPMVPIGNRPILWHIMKTFAHHGHTDFLLCLGYKSWVIKEFFLHYEAMKTDLTITLGRPSDVEILSPMDEEGWSITLAETGLESMTGYRVLQGKKYVEDSPFFFTYGDGVSDVDISALLAFHRSHGKIGTMTGVRPPSRFGEIERDGQRVSSFAEKPQAAGGRINGGFCIFEPGIFDFIDDDPNVVFEQEPLRKLAAAGELMVFEHDGYWQPMDTMREFLLLNDLWKSGQAPWKVWP